MGTKPLEKDIRVLFHNMFQWYFSETVLIDEREKEYTKYSKVQFLKTIRPHYGLSMYVMYCPVKTNHSEKCLPFLFLSVAKSRIGKRSYCIGNTRPIIRKYLSDDCRYKNSECNVFIKVAKLSCLVIFFFFLLIF